MRSIIKCKHCGKEQPKKSDTRVPVANGYVTLAESQVLALRAQGLSSRKIGERLGKSFKTVEKLMANACERLDVPNNFQLVEIYKASETHQRARQIQ